MSVTDEVLGEHAGGAAVLGVEGIDTLHLASGDAHCGTQLGDLPHDVIVGAAARHEGDTVDPAEQVEHRCGPVLVGLGEDEHHGEPMLRGRDLEPDQELRVVRAGDVREHDTEGPAAANGQGTSRSSRDVPQLSRRCDDAVAGALRDLGGVPEGAAHGGDRHSGALGDLVDGGPGQSLPVSHHRDLLLVVESWRCRSVASGAALGSPRNGSAYSLTRTVCAYIRVGKRNADVIARVQAAWGAQPCAACRSQRTRSALSPPGVSP